MKRPSTMVRLDRDVLTVARHISEATGKPVSTIVEDACRDVFKWWLEGAAQSLSMIGKGEKREHDSAVTSD